MSQTSSVPQVVKSVSQVLTPDILRTRSNRLAATTKDQTTDNPKPPLAAPKQSRLNPKPDGPEPPLNQAATCLKSSDDGH